MNNKIPYSEVSLGGKDLALESTSWKLVEHYIQPIKKYWQDPSVTSIAVNRYDIIFVRKNGVWEKSEVQFESEKVLVDAITQIIRALGQDIDKDKAPIADGRLFDGSRINAVLSPTAPKGSNLTIRIFPKVRYTLEDLLKKGALNQEMLEFLRLAVMCEYNIINSGATGSGKTTILNALGNLGGDEIRTGVLEDTSELNIDKPNIIYLEAPKRAIKSDDGRQIVTMETLLETVLRQELGSLCVGEIRNPQAATALMLALNTGHRGVKSTLHANNDKAAVRRIINMLLSNDTRIPYDAVQTEIFENIDLIIQSEHTPRHGKRIVQISEIADNEVRRLYEWDYLEGVHKRIWTVNTPTRLHSLINKYDVELPSELKY